MVARGFLVSRDKSDFGTPSPYMYIAAMYKLFPRPPDSAPSLGARGSCPPVPSPSRRHWVLSIPCIGNVKYKLKAKMCWTAKRLRNSWCFERLPSFALMKGFFLKTSAIFTLLAVPYFFTFENWFKPWTNLWFNVVINVCPAIQWGVLLSTLKFDSNELLW